MQLPWQTGLFAIFLILRDFSAALVNIFWTRHYVKIRRGLYNNCSTHPAILDRTLKKCRTWTTDGNKLISISEISVAVGLAICSTSFHLRHVHNFPILCPVLVYHYNAPLQIAYYLRQHPKGGIWATDYFLFSLLYFSFCNLFRHVIFGTQLKNGTVTHDDAPVDVHQDRARLRQIRLP